MGKVFKTRVDEHLKAVTNPYKQYYTYNAYTAFFLSLKWAALLNTYSHHLSLTSIMPPYFFSKSLLPVVDSPTILNPILNPSTTFFFWRNNYERL